LEQGRAERAIDPTSAIRQRTAVVGQPAHGDLDSDGHTDTALILAHHTGGSGTFYYVVAARGLPNGYRGSNGVLLGDRVRVEDVSLRQGLVVVRYLDREAGEPMAAEPTVAHTMILKIERGELLVRAELERDEQLLAGWLRLGHEVRSFTPCGQDVVHWIVGDSAALDEVFAGYRELAGDAEPYAPVFMLGAGRFAEPPGDGFGADYVKAVDVTRLFEIRSDGDCGRQPDQSGVTDSRH
jgi:hypothetical protein